MRKQRPARGSEKDRLWHEQSIQPSVAQHRWTVPLTFMRNNWYVQYIKDKSLRLQLTALLWTDMKTDFSLLSILNESRIWLPGAKSAEEVAIISQAFCSHSPLPYFLSVESHSPLLSAGLCLQSAPVQHHEICFFYTIKRQLARQLNIC